MLDKSYLFACLLALGCGTDEAGSRGGNGTGSTGSAGSNASAGSDEDANGGPTGSANGNGGQEVDAGTTGGNGQGDSVLGPPLVAACNGKVKPGVSGELPQFKKETISTIKGAAYMLPADLNGDGFSEYLLTLLSEDVDLSQILNGIPLADGGAYVLRRDGGKPDGTLGKWSTTKAFDRTEKIGFPNSSELFDVDGDGIKDWVIGAGFLIKPTGKIAWLKGSKEGTFAKAQLVTVPDAKCWYHITLGLDMDGDKDNDFVTSCHVGDTSNPIKGASRVEWFENDGKGVFTSHAIGDGGGSLLSLYDMDADGDQDVIAPQFFGPESMVWFEQTGAKGSKWAKHLINNTTGRGFIVKYADMNGDGKLDLVYGNHNNEEAAAPNNVMGVYWFEFPPADKVATLDNWDAYKHTVFEGFKVDGSNNADSAGSPGMINVGDVDGDCDIDVSVSGDGDPGLYVFVQQSDKFEQVELFRDPTNANSGEQHFADLDGDGDLDLIWAVFGPSGMALALDSHIYAFLQD